MTINYSGHSRLLFNYALRPPVSCFIYWDFLQLGNPPGMPPHPFLMSLADGYRTGFIRKTSGTSGKTVPASSFAEWFLGANLLGSKFSWRLEIWFDFL
ncbi:hypothetical protein TNCT_617161 [Trichonephila clavata]|uniref:Uncharacterized protein n=1 Tax=Trichonephila clavata TaxID=2740835 RepID=A0A8X6H9F1_TRICU|nr:hypothetical protein TNCT_617161 [Trichonephila clavata]